VNALALLTEPVIPQKAQSIWEALGNSDAISGHSIQEALTEPKGHPLPSPKPLFEKLDDTLIAELDALLGKRVEEASRKPVKQDIITIEEFSRIEIRIGKVISAENVPKSKKLLKLQVDLGTEQRQIVSGIAQFYDPAELAGKLVVVLTNLAPATIFGIESNGMILAAGDSASLLVPLREVEPGTKIR